MRDTPLSAFVCAGSQSLSRWKAAGQDRPESIDPGLLSARLGAAAMSATTMRPDTTAAEVLARLTSALINLNYRAKREYPRSGTVKYPTPWDMRHREMDELLTRMGL